MSKRYPGGILSRSAPTIVGPTDGEGGSAPGVWTLEQASGYVKQGTWPLPLKQGGLWSWGMNAYGQLGQNNSVYKSSPVQVGLITSWNKIYSGNSHTLAIKTDGTLWSWGRDNSGQLGQGGVMASSSPVQIGALTTWSMVCAVNDSSFAIKNNGTLWAWGANGYGQLGINTSTNVYSPVQVGALTTWLKIGGGNQCALAIKTDGTLWTWGRNREGQLGQNDTVYRSSPVQIGALTTWSKVVVGCCRISAAIKNDGTLWVWGANSQGELGQNDRVYRSSPVQVGLLNTWSMISSGQDSFTVALKTDGTMWSWGDNNGGQLGQNTTYMLDRSSPVQIGSLTTWSKANCGSAHTQAIKTNGTLWTWGNNGYGELGQNDTVARSNPTQVGSLTTWVNIASMQNASIATKT